jgi:alcohol dehydrogenase class IV
MTTAGTGHNSRPVKVITDKKKKKKPYLTDVVIYKTASTTSSPRSSRNEQIYSKI